MPLESINDDIFEDHQPHGAVDKIIYYLFFYVPGIELISLPDEESAVKNRLIEHGLWNKSDRVKTFLVVTVCAFVTWGGLLIGADLIPSISALSLTLGEYASSGFFLIVAFAFTQAAVTNLPQTPWLPGERSETVEYSQLIASFLVTLALLLRAAFGSSLIGILIIGISVTANSVEVGVILSYLILLIPVVYISGWLMPRTAVVSSTDELNGWHEAFTRYEELAERASSLAQAVEQDRIFELRQYNPRDTNSLEAAWGRLERFERYVDSYDQLLASHSKAENLVGSGSDSELLALADEYIQPYDSPEQAAEKADELQRIVEQFPTYEAQYQEVQRLSESVGCADDFENAVPTPEGLLKKAEPKKLDEATQRLGEWRTIYTEYLRLSNKLRHGTSPNLGNLTDLKGIGNSRQQALAEVGIKTPRDLHEADIERIARVKGINRQLASALKSRVQDPLYSIQLEDIEGVGPQTALKLRRNDIESVQALAEASPNELQSTEGIGPKKAERLRQTAGDVIGSPPPESHCTTLLNRYSPAVANLDDAKSQIGQLEAWIKAYERYFELRHRASMVSFDFNETAPWNFENLGAAQDDLDTVEQAIECVEQHQRLLNELETRSDKTTNKKEAEFVSRICQNLQTSSFEWTSDPVTISKTFDSIERILNLGNQIVSAQREYPAYPFEQLLDTLASEVEDGLESVGKIEMVSETINSSLFILNYLDTVETNHPSIGAEHWRAAVRTALQEQYPDQLTPIKRQIERLKNSRWRREDLDTLDWEEFESIVGILFEERGFDAETTRGAIDLGVDVWAESEDERIAIQAKHYAAGNTVGRETLQKLTSTLAKGDADRAVVVTSSSFADTAVRYANDFGAGLQLIDGDELLRELTELEIPPPT